MRTLIRQIKNSNLHNIRTKNSHNPNIKITLEIIKNNYNSNLQNKIIIIKERQLPKVIGYK